MNGYLVNSNGPKMYAKGLDRDERLMGLAFLDINLYATSLKTFKNFALVGDLTKSMWLISFQVCQISNVASRRELMCTGEPIQARRGQQGLARGAHGHGRLFGARRPGRFPVYGQIRQYAHAGV